MVFCKELQLLINFLLPKNSTYTHKHIHTHPRCVCRVNRFQSTLIIQVINLTKLDKNFDGGASKATHAKLRSDISNGALICW